MGVHAGGVWSGRCFGFPLSIVKYLCGEGLGQDAGLASQALCSLQGTFTLWTSLVCSLRRKALLTPLMDGKAEVSMGGGPSPQAAR